MLYLWIQVCVYVSYYDNYFCFRFSIKWFHTKYYVASISIYLHVIYCYIQKKYIYISYVLVCFWLTIYYIPITSFIYYMLFGVKKKSNNSCFIWQKCIYSFSYKALYNNLQISYRYIYGYSASLWCFLDVK